VKKARLGYECICCALFLWQV